MFCINGMEIDLTELNEFEAKLNAKRKLASENAVQSSDATTNAAAGSSAAALHVHHQKNDDEIDELDEYLNQLAIDIKLRDKSAETAAAAAAASVDVKLHAAAADDQPAVVADDQAAVVAVIRPAPPTVPFAVLLYWFMGIVFFVNTVKRTSCKRPQPRTNSMGN